MIMRNIPIKGDYNMQWITLFIPQSFANNP